MVQKELLKIYARNNRIHYGYVIVLAALFFATRFYIYGVPSRISLFVFAGATLIAAISHALQQTCYKIILSRKSLNIHSYIIGLFVLKCGLILPVLGIAFWPINAEILYEHLFGYVAIVIGLALNAALGSASLILFFGNIMVYSTFAGLIIYSHYNMQETLYVGGALLLFALFSVGLGLKIHSSSLELVKKTALLNKAAQSAARANKAKSDFLAVMSHEIRTPMNGILGMVDTLKETDMNPTQSNAVNTILACSDTLLNTLNDILDISKIEAGKFAINHEPYDFHKLIRDVGRLYEAHVAGKNVEFITRISDHTPQFLIGDEKRIRQIIMNLVNNALKFTSEGHVALYASCVEKDGMSYMLIEIHDTGIGISEKNQGKLFKQFSQVDSSIAMKYGGTGLGLSISQKLVHLMEGHIGVDSQEGSGSVFWFDIPCNLADAKDTKQMAETKDTAPEPIGPQRILLADDNHLNQSIVQKLLENKSHVVTLAMNGEEAIKQVRENDFDLILMDINMPFIDGIEATKEIKKLGGRKAAIPVIALTASTKQEIINICLEIGMVDYLLKPIEKNKLYEAISHFGNKDTAITVADEDAPVPANGTNEKLQMLIEEFGEEYTAALVGQFLDAFETKLAELEQALTDKDHKTIAFIAHDLSGMFGNIGMDESCHYARLLETAATRKDGDYEVLIQEMRAHYKSEKEHVKSIT